MNEPQRTSSLCLRFPTRKGEEIPREWWQSYQPTLPYQAKEQCGRVGPHYVTPIGRSTAGINKTQFARMMGALVKAIKRLR